MTSDPILDTTALDRLEEWGGAKLREKMIELFFQNAPERVQGIRSGLADGNIELAERSAHSLKSSAANLGGEVVRKLSAGIEDALEAGNREGAERLLPDLEARFSDMMDALRKAAKAEQA